VPHPDRARRDAAIIGAVRIVAGLLWLANLEWKRPPDFGLNNKNGLYKYVDAAVSHKVFAPWSWIVEHVVLKHYTMFGWSTLLLESALAALLLIGLWTRPVALLGAVNSLAIGLSVLYYPNEWPWSYYLMIALHLVLFATAAGQSVGLDGVRQQGAEARRRAVLVLGGIAAVVGVVALLVASSRGFTAHQGKLLGWSRGELKLLWFNPLSALLTIAFGGIAVVSSVVRRTPLAWVAVAGFVERRHPRRYRRQLRLLVDVRDRHRGVPRAARLLPRVHGLTSEHAAAWARRVDRLGAGGRLLHTRPVRSANDDHHRRADRVVEPVPYRAHVGHPPRRGRRAVPGGHDVRLRALDGDGW
jgi:uncharacterized membrane protein YphA (DoxX/SURF4 family)